MTGYAALAHLLIRIVLRQEAEARAAHPEWSEEEFGEWWRQQLPTHNTAP